MSAVTISGVGDQHLDDRPEFSRAALADEAFDERAGDPVSQPRRSNQGQGADAVGLRQGDRCRDGAAEGVADEMGRIDTDRIEVVGNHRRQRGERTVVELLRRSTVPRQVEREDRTVLGERRMVEHPRGHVGTEAVQEDDRLALVGTGAEMAEPPPADLDGRGDRSVVPLRPRPA
jgi:hypothetical protein